MKASVKMHPETLYARMHASISVVLRIENSKESRWVEADIEVHEKLSLASDTQLKKGRFRVGIAGTKEAIEKSVKVYSSEYTDAQRYSCRIVVFTYDKDGVIDERIEIPFIVKCEEQKPAVI